MAIEYSHILVIYMVLLNSIHIHRLHIVGGITYEVYNGGRLYLQNTNTWHTTHGIIYIYCCLYSMKHIIHMRNAYRLAGRCYGT